MITRYLAIPSDRSFISGTSIWSTAAGLLSTLVRIFIGVLKIVLLNQRRKISHLRVLLGVRIPTMALFGCPLDGEMVSVCLSSVPCFKCIIFYLWDGQSMFISVLLSLNIIPDFPFSYTLFLGEQDSLTTVNHTGNVKTSRTWFNSPVPLPL